MRYNTIMEAVAADEPRMACITHTAGDVEVFRLELLMLPAWSPDHTQRWAVSFCFYF